MAEQLRCLEIQRTESSDCSFIFVKGEIGTTITAKILVLTNHQQLQFFLQMFPFHK